MQEVTFTLRTITPLFLAGADYQLIPIPDGRQRDQYQRGESSFATHGWDIQAEIRPPSFRGLMRYWLRTLVNGLSDTATVNLNDVIQFEQSIFGSTEQGSPISIRIIDVSKKAKRFEKDKESFSQKTITGRDYLLWSMAESGRALNYKPNRYYFPEDTQFKIVLSERIADPATPPVLPYAIASMWLLTYLGGIGSRSHRCAGSLAVQHVTGNTFNLPFVEAVGTGGIQKTLQQGILEVRKLGMAYLQRLEKQDNTVSLVHSPFDSLLLPHHCRIWILTQNAGSPWSSIKDAMDTIGTRLKEYRGSLTPSERAVFGLPVNVKNLPDRDLEKALKNSRRSSPLLLRITKLRDGGYVGIAVLFKTPALPIFGPDKTNPGKKRILIPIPDYTLIENWVTTAFPQPLEVEL